MSRLERCSAGSRNTPIPGVGLGRPKSSDPPKKRNSATVNGWVYFRETFSPGKDFIVCARRGPHVRAAKPVWRLRNAGSRWKPTRRGYAWPRPVASGRSRGLYGKKRKRHAHFATVDGDCASLGETRAEHCQNTFLSRIWIRQVYGRRKGTTNGRFRASRAPPNPRSNAVTYWPWKLLCFYETKIIHSKNVFYEFHAFFGESKKQNKNFPPDGYTFFFFFFGFSTVVLRRNNDCPIPKRFWILQKYFFFAYLIVLNYFFKVDIIAYTEPLAHSVSSELTKILFYR